MFPPSLVELYNHLSMVTRLSSLFNQTSGAEEKVLLDFYMSGLLSRIVQLAVKRNSGNYRFVAIATKGRDLQGFFWGGGGRLHGKMNCTTGTFMEGGLSFTSVGWKGVLMACRFPQMSINEAKRVFSIQHIYIFTASCIDMQDTRHTVFR